ncbi:MAG: biotin--[acetyl-CoA-carboxylase] ligase [Desulfonauticus sp.]|nr:biotin--[acetyl-CoA-carboxylase] ligase [Desulfonauticus sp.]
MTATLGGLYQIEPLGEHKIFIFECCSSTMDEGWRLFKEGLLQTGDSVLAYSQTRGRGQLGRKWLSKKGNLYVSWLEKSFWFGNRLIPLKVGLLLAKALQKKSLPIRLKWPNDLILDTRKVGGILVEEKLDYFLIGLGLNLRQSPSLLELDKEGLFLPGDLSNFLPEQEPLAFWKELYLEYKNSSEELKGSREFIQELNQTLAFQGKEVVVQDGQKVIQGKMLGIGENGELQLVQETDIINIYAGSIVQVLDT